MDIVNASDVFSLNNSNLQIVVKARDYDFGRDTRLLIPFIAYLNKSGKRNKMGLINKDGRVVVEPIFDIILDECHSSSDIVRVGTLFPFSYQCSNGNVDAHVRYKYRAVNSKGDFLLGDMDFDGILPSVEKLLLTVHDREKGYAVYDTAGNEIVPFGRYSWIDGFDHGLARAKQGKVSNAVINDTNRWGLINDRGEEVLPLEYNNIWNFFNKGRSSTKVFKDGVESIIYFKDLTPDFNNSLKSDFDNCDTYGNNYGEYEGSYAQDVMGFSDDEIADAFDGDPEAYWNID